MAAIGTTYDHYKVSNEVVKQLQPVILADQSKDCYQVSIAIMNCFKKYSNFTLQDVEWVLRKNKCRSYLIAADKRASFSSAIQFMLFQPNGTRIAKTYALNVNTMRIEGVKKEMFLESPPQKPGDFDDSYRQNFEKLNQTGFIIQMDDTTSLLKSCQKGSVEFRDPNALNTEIQKLNNNNQDKQSG